MKMRLIKLRDKLADSFWFPPAAMAVLASTAALGSVALDHAIGVSWVRSIGWVWSGGADGARSVLSVVAGSVMTVISIVFSLTIATLSQTSSHYGPRVLRNFTSDRRVQLTLGTFIATFVYCLLVLRTVRSVQESTFVPYLSVNVGVLLALASLAVLIFYIHHVAQTIQAENLIADVGEDFHRTLPTFFPERVGAEPADGPAPDASRWEACGMVKAAENGYLLRINEEALVALATKHDLLLELEKRPGEFVSTGVFLIRVCGRLVLSDNLAREMRACFSQGTHRTPHQDALYSVQQLVEIAAHALSPGINEPFTALTCIDWLGSSLRAVAGREVPGPECRDEHGIVRVVARRVSFEELARGAFDQIRIYGASNPEVMICLLDTIASLASEARRPTDRAVLRYHAQLIGTDAGQVENETDRERVAQHLRATLGILSATEQTSFAAPIKDRADARHEVAGIILS